MMKRSSVSAFVHSLVQYCQVMHDEIRQRRINRKIAEKIVSSQSEKDDTYLRETLIDKGKL